MKKTTSAAIMIIAATAMYMINNIEVKCAVYFAMFITIGLINYDYEKESN